MTEREVLFKCLNCGHQYPGMFDMNDIKERTCPKCRSNSVRRLPKPKKK